MMPTRAEILDKLRRIYDPCSVAMGNPTDIATLGLIERILVEPGQVTVELCLTDPSCVHFNALRHHVEAQLLGLPGVERVHTTQTVQVLWTPDRVGRDRACPRGAA